MPTTGSLTVKAKGRTIFQGTMYAGGDEQPDLARWILNRPTSLASFAKLAMDLGVSAEEDASGDVKYIVDLTKRKVTYVDHWDPPQVFTFASFATRAGLRKPRPARPVKFGPSQSSKTLAAYLRERGNTRGNTWQHLAHAASLLASESHTNAKIESTLRSPSYFCGAPRALTYTRVGNPVTPSTRVSGLSGPTLYVGTTLPSVAATVRTAGWMRAHHGHPSMEKKSSAPPSTAGS